MLEPASSISARHQSLLLKAATALENGNVDYALQACGEILSGDRTCLPARKRQRDAALIRYERGWTLWAGIRGWIAIVPLYFGRANGADALFVRAEKILAADPTNIIGLKLLAAAADRLGLPDTAVFALEASCVLEPENVDVRIALADALLSAGRPAAALACGELAVKLRPGDARAIELVREASVAVTMEHGTWAASPPPQRPSPSAMNPTQRVLSEA